MTEHAAPTSAHPWRPANGWGPDRRRAAVSLTFDHLGEANEIEQGRWPAGKPIGQHPSVTTALPRLLALLARHGLKGSFFVEGWNALVYPDALRQIVEHGHELGYHGWRHEAWSALTPAEEHRLVGIGMRELRRLDLPVSGFRTPGGGHTRATLEALRAHGLRYVSDEGVAAGVRPDGIVQLPYQWRAVDAFYFSDRLGSLRQQHGETAEPLLPERFRAALDRAIEDVIEQGDTLSVLFHPFLLPVEAGDRWAIVEATAQRLAEDARVWCVPNGVLAAWLLEAAEREDQAGLSTR